MAAEFRITYASNPFINQVHTSKFEGIVQASALALQHDEFIRNAYYAVYVGSTNFPMPSSEQRESARLHLDRYLLRLPKISVEKIQDPTYPRTQRPQAGDSTIHLNSSLCAALTVDKSGSDEFTKLLIAKTILHETAHTYGFYACLDNPRYSPQALPIAGYEETVKVGSIDHIVGEVVERAVFGGILFAVVSEDSHGFATINGVQLERDGVFYDISVLVAANWIVLRK